MKQSEEVQSLRESLVSRLNREGIAELTTGGMDTGEVEQKAGPAMPLASSIDHTLLKPEASREHIVRLCEQAMEFDFASVCVNPYWVRTASRRLEGSGIGVASVIGFPLGAQTARIKAAEAQEAAMNGANEMDMVLNVGALKSDDAAAVYRDIKAVVDAVAGRAIVKVILETGLLTDQEKKIACVLSELAGAHFVKTSTGFGPGGATVEDIRLMRLFTSPRMRVKASGGIRTAAIAEQMIQAGATRLGTSSGVQIVKGEEGTGY